MASIALGALGAGIGSVFGAPLLGYEVGATAGSLADMYLFRGQNDVGKLSSLRVSSSSYGADIPRIWGKMRLPTNMIWADNLVQVTPSQGGGSAASPQTVNYTYTCSFAVMVCAGPVSSVDRIWGEDILLYDSTYAGTTGTNIAIYTGTSTQGEDPTILATSGTTPGYQDYCYIVFTDLNLTPWGQRVPNITVEVDGGSTTIGAIVSSVAELAGLQSSQLDVSQGTQAITGFVSTSRKSSSTILQPLLDAWPVDIIEIDGVLRIVARGGAPVVTIPEGDLGAAVGNSKAPRMRVERMDDTQLPRRVDVTFYEEYALYEVSSQTSVRAVMTNVEQSDTLNLPMVLDETTAREIGERVLYTRWRERSLYTFALPVSYLALAPGDVVMLPVGGQNVRARITMVDMSLPGAIRFQAVPDALDLLTQVAPGAPVTNPVLSVYGNNDVTSLAWNGNALTDADAQGNIGIYAAACWDAYQPGVSLFQSRDNGNSWQQLASFSQFSVIGSCLTQLPDYAGETALWDNISTVDVQVQRGSLSSAGIWDIIAGSNSALVGNEVVQFLNAVNIGNNQYRLSGLLRGRRGTDYAAGSHVSGEAFLLLDSNAQQRITFDNSVLGQSLQLRFVQHGQSLGSATTQNVQLAGAELKPYAPCHVGGTRDGSNNLTVTWVRRARFGGQWADYIDVTESDPPESYVLEVWNSGFTAVLRTITGLAAPTASYTAAEQTVDGITPGNPVSVKIYELNATVGRGYPASGVL